MRRRDAVLRRCGDDEHARGTVGVLAHGHSALHSVCWWGPTRSLRLNWLHP